MKLLTTIAAVLISISAYSQDLIKYENGTFSQNGEELSMEQISDLTLLHQAGRGNFRRGINFDEMHKNMYLRGVNNSVNLVGGAATGFCGGFGVWLSSILIYDELLSAAAFVIGPTTVLCAVSLNAFSRIASKDMCLPRRDRQFNKVADKINQAIQSSNQ